MQKAQKKFTVRDAVNVLLQDCDGALTEDGVGFNKFDAGFARDLVQHQKWTDKQQQSVYKMLKKYEDQLLHRYDIEYDSLKFEKTKKVVKRLIGVVESDEYFYVKFKYKAELVQAVKNHFSNRVYNSNEKRWEIPINQISVKQVFDFAKKYDFSITKNVESKIKKLKKKKLDSDTSDTKDKKIKSDKVIGCVRKNDSEYFAVKFPYNKKIVNAIKKIPGRKYANKSKMWFVPANIVTMKRLSAFAKKYSFSFTRDADLVRRDILDRVSLSKADNKAGVKINIEGLNKNESLREFQKAGVKYILDRKRIFIADQQGLGKTVEAIASVQKLNNYPVLIICPATLKIKWSREFEKWVPGLRTKIINGRDNKFCNIKTDAEVYIINYSIVHYNEDVLSKLKFESVIIDESHKLKNHKAKRTKAVKNLVNKDVKPEVRLLLSGTPIKNRPKELISQLEILGRLDDLGGFYYFTRRYCDATKTYWGWDMNGASNLEELNQALRSICYVRRLKKDVLKELPDKTISQIVFDDISNCNDYKLAERDICRWIRENIGEEGVEKAQKAEAIVKLNRLRQLVAGGKKKYIIDWVRDFLESGEKLVLFAHHDFIVEDIAEEFNASFISGKTSSSQDEESKDSFQNGEEQLIIISLQAGSEGIDLYASSNVAFAELGWTPGDHEQAEDRLHRIGQEDAVNCWYLIAKNTIDEYMMEIIEEKREIIDQAIDGAEIEDEVWKKREGSKVREAMKEDVVQKVLDKMSSK